MGRLNLGNFTEEATFDKLEFVQGLNSKSRSLCSLAFQSRFLKRVPVCWGPLRLHCRRAGVLFEGPIQTMEMLHLGAWWQQTDRRHTTLAETEAFSASAAKLASRANPPAETSPRPFASSAMPLEGCLEPKWLRHPTPCVQPQKL